MSVLSDTWAAGTEKVGQRGLGWLRGADIALGEKWGKIKLE